MVPSLLSDSGWGSVALSGQPLGLPARRPPAARKGFGLYLGYSRSSDWGIGSTSHGSWLGFSLFSEGICEPSARRHFQLNGYGVTSSSGRSTGWPPICVHHTSRAAVLPSPPLLPSLQPAVSPTRATATTMAAASLRRRRLMMRKVA